MTFQATALLLTWAAIALLALAMSGILRQVRMLSNPHPNITLSTPHIVGKPAARLGNGQPTWTKPTALLFVTADCPVCQDRLAELEALTAADGEGLGFAAVFPGGTGGWSSDRIHVFADQDTVFSEFGVPVTPYGVVVGPEGLVRHAQRIGSAEAVHELIEATRGVKDETPA